MLLSPRILSIKDLTNSTLSDQQSEANQSKSSIVPIHLQLLLEMTFNALFLRTRYNELPSVITKEFLK
jgi:hypothetical protein